jgi:hypothetical protein
MDFDYQGPPVPETTVADVVADICSHGKLPPLTPEQIEQRKLDAQLHAVAWLERDEERRFEHERKRAAQQAEAQRQATIAQAEASRKSREERYERIERETRQREVRDLRLKAAKQDWFAGAATNAIRQQQWQRTLDAEIERRKPIIAALETLANPPPDPER